MLSNAYFLAKFRFDTAEKEPAKNLQNYANFPNSANPNPYVRAQVRLMGMVWLRWIFPWRPTRSTRRASGRLRRPRVTRRPGRAGGQRASVGKISAKRCSFSAVSAPIFASKCAFCSIFQNLPDSQADFVFQFGKFCNFSDICKFCAEFSQKMLKFQTDFLRKF